MDRFLVMTYSPKLRGAARQSAQHYLGIRVVETTDGLRPASVRSKTVVRVIRECGGLHFGKTMRSEGRQALAECEELAARLNREAQS